MNKDNGNEVDAAKVTMAKKHVSENKPKVRIGSGSDYLFVKEVVNSHGLHTICQSGNCPNISECWGNRTATFMILGEICTRGCRFCSVLTGKPLLPDPDEPAKLAQSVQLMKLKTAVITSVDRDDLDDCGASHWASVIRKVKQENRDTKLEVLIPDFKGKPELIDRVIAENPDIISHNIETVKRLSPLVRPAASYETSLRVLLYMSGKGVRIKSGIMTGLGETMEELDDTLRDIFNTGCRIVTIGQYLQPGKSELQVQRYYNDEEFYQLKMKAYEIGFKIVESGKLIRSSYHAENHHA